MVFVLHGMEPCQHVTLEILHRAVLCLMLHIEYRRQVAWFKMHIGEKELRLLLGRRLYAEEVISTADEAMLTRLEEILVEILVHNVRPLGSLDKHEAHRASVDVRRAEQRPVNLTLIMRHVYAVYLVPVRIVGVTVQRLPAERCRRHEEVPEGPCIDGDKQKATQPPYPLRMAAESLDFILSCFFLSH